MSFEALNKVMVSKILEILSKHDARALAFDDQQQSFVL